MPKFMKSKWFLPAVVLLYGGGLTVVTWRIEGEHSEALKGLGLILVIALALLAAGYSKKLRRQLLGDERSDTIGLLAGWGAGVVLFQVIFTCLIVEAARGHSVYPYFWLAALYVGLLSLFRIIQNVRR
jgi:drug/metabolite transporter (DMT)-like permease